MKAIASYPSTADLLAPHQLSPPLARREAVTAALVSGGGLAPALPLWFWWALSGGGYPTALWLAGFAYLALVATLLLRFAEPARISRVRAAVLVALGALVIWGLLSLAWAPDKGLAWIAGERTALLATAVALPVLWPPRESFLMPATLAAIGAAALAAIYAVVTMVGDPASLEDGRLIEPTGYPNATAALFLASAIPAALLASRREIPPLVRALCLGSAGLLASASILAQSRGSVAALAVTLAAAFALVPSRARLLLPLTFVALAVALAADPLLSVHAASVSGAPVPAGNAALALAIVFAALAGIGLLYAAGDRRIADRGGTGGRADRVLAVVALVAAIGAGAWFVAEVGDPFSWGADRVNDFTDANYKQLESSSSRFSGDLGTNRADYWRASLEVFKERPVTGAGAGNFLASYLKIRESRKAPLYAHSIWLGALAENGAIGLGLMLGLAGAFIIACRNACRRATPARRAVIAAAVLPLVYVGAHASFDWVSSFPAVALPALGLAGAACAVRPVRRPGRSLGGGAPIVATALICLVAVGGLPLMASSWLTDRAAAGWRSDPDGALADLQLARRLDPLSAAPAINEGVIALRLDRRVDAAQAFGDALARDHSAWFASFELGLIASERGDRSAAIDHLQRALGQNPAERLVSHALEAVRAGRSPDPLALAVRVIEKDG